MGIILSQFIDYSYHYYCHVIEFLHHMFNKHDVNDFEM